MADKPLDKSSPKAAPPRLMDAQAVEQLFLRFAAIWGHRWTSLFQSPQLLTVAKAEWFGDLEFYSVEIVTGAIVRAKSDHTDFPPTLPQFTELCTAVHNERMRVKREAEAASRRAAYVPEPVDHEKVQRDKAEAQAAFKRLLSKFGVNA